MAKNKKNLTGKKNKKTVRQTRSFFVPLLHVTICFLFNMMVKMSKGGGRLILWLIKTLYVKGKNNPLAALSLCLFFFVFAVVALNAFVQSHLFIARSSFAIPDQSVMERQRKLKEIGLYDGGIDGLTGPKTRSAFENWQKLQVSLEQGKQQRHDLSSPRSQESYPDPLAHIIRNARE